MHFKSITNHLLIQKSLGEFRILIQKRFAETTFSKGYSKVSFTKCHSYYGFHDPRRNGDTACMMID